MAITLNTNIKMIFSFIKHTLNDIENIFSSKYVYIYCCTKNKDVLGILIYKNRKRQRKLEKAGKRPVFFRFNEK